PAALQRRLGGPADRHHAGPHPGPLRKPAPPPHADAHDRRARRRRAGHRGRRGREAVADEVEPRAGCRHGEARSRARILRPRDDAHSAGRRLAARRDEVDYGSGEVHLRPVGLVSQVGRVGLMGRTATQAPHTGKPDLLNRSASSEDHWKPGLPRARTHDAVRATRRTGPPGPTELPGPPDPPPTLPGPPPPPALPDPPAL